MGESYREALVRGLPFPILTVAEYFSLGQEGFAWGGQYRAAGYYGSILLWWVSQLFEECMYKVRSRRVHVTMVAVQNSKYYAFELCVFAKRMRRTILSSAACPAVQFFFLHCLINGTIFGKIFFNMKCSMADFSRPRTVTVRLTSCSYLYLCFCCRGSGDGERKTHQS